MKPLVFNLFKPAGITSHDVVRHLKRNLPKPFKKIGHFGTLDPFACGVLMIGINGAARLNDFIHEFHPKTYLAVGKLCVHTDTGDMTSDILERDIRPELHQKLKGLSVNLLQELFEKKFLGQYYQSPHKFSAAKFEGKKLYEWAREGVEIKKDKVERFIHSIEIVRYEFPYLSIRVTVSSGTYIRSLFADMAKELGTVGTLVSLVRESIGPMTTEMALKKGLWPNRETHIWDSDKMYGMGHSMESVLPLIQIDLCGGRETLYRNGGVIEYCDNESRANSIISTDKFAWVYAADGSLIGMGLREDGQLRAKFTLPQGM